MSLTKISGNTTSNLDPTPSVRNGDAKLRPASSFADTLANLGNGTCYTDEEVKGFFANMPNTDQIASKAANLGLSVDQISRAMSVGGYSGEISALRAGVEDFVSISANGYAWNSSGVLSVSKSSIQSTVPSEKVSPSAQEAKAFYAAGPSDAQVTEKVKSLGLNAAQMVRFQVAGMGMNLNQVSAPVLESMYVDAAKRLGSDIGGGKNGGWTSYFSPTLGRSITKSEIQTFFASNPSQSEIFQKASDLGIGVAAVNNMMVGAGITKSENAYAAYSQMDFALFRSSNGFSLDQYGHIVPGGGHTFVGEASGNSGTWNANAASGTTVNKSA